MQNRKGESPMENTNVLFDRKRLVRLIVPLIVEQVLAVTVGHGGHGDGIRGR